MIWLRRSDFFEAAADFNHALELDPKLGAGYRDRGVLKASQGDLAGALDECQTAIIIDKTDAPAYRDRAIVKIANADLNGALVDLRRSIELSSQNDRTRFYCEIYLWVVLALQNQITEANQGLTDYIQSGLPTDAEPWVSSIANFLLDKADENSFLAAAKEGDNHRMIQGQSCESWFFAGLKCKLAGAREKATDCFRRCLATKQTAYFESILAAAQLKQSSSD